MGDLFGRTICQDFVFFFYIRFSRINFTLYIGFFYFKEREYEVEYPLQSAFEARLVNYLI